MTEITGWDETYLKIREWNFHAHSPGDLLIWLYGNPSRTIVLRDEDRELTITWDEETHGFQAQSGECTGQLPDGAGGSQ